MKYERDFICSENKIWPPTDLMVLLNNERFRCWNNV